MSNIDSIRFHVARAHREHAAATAGSGGPAPHADKVRDEELVHHLEHALVDSRTKFGVADEGTLIGRYGFHADDLRRLGQRALDAATTKWVGNSLLEHSAP